jgi:hypothetical protein
MSGCERNWSWFYSGTFPTFTVNRPRKTSIMIIDLRFKIPMLYLPNMKHDCWALDMNRTAVLGTWKKWNSATRTPWNASSVEPKEFECAGELTTPKSRPHSCQHTRRSVWYSKLSPLRRGRRRGRKWLLRSPVDSRLWPSLDPLGGSGGGTTCWKRKTIFCYTSVCRRERRMTSYRNTRTHRLSSLFV